ncbi:MAG: hypothetical protein EAZ53_17190 [Bacteroidetes bacterium]|nr:MAG: hypothetical protein EAZ53_17190 [Bacteroidota bacterium]
MKNTIAEAQRYIDNAKEILSTKANKEDGYYQDKKYIKLAGHAAYSGVLVALDTILASKEKGRKSVDWYKSELAKIDKKVLNYFDTTYQIFHLVMGYDGHGKAKLAQEGFEDADKLIRWVETKIIA